MHKAGDKIGPLDAPWPKRMRDKTFVRLAPKYLKARKELVEAQQEQFSRSVEQMEQEKIKYDL
jgi:hypothetical protein